MKGMTPEDYLVSPEIYKWKKTQVGLGVVIENYSQYNLKFPTVNFENSAGREVEKHEVQEIGSGKSNMFILDNGGHRDFRLDGSLSWQVMLNSRHLIRLVLTFYIPYA